jgi:hypothetical protein
MARLFRTWQAKPIRILTALCLLLLMNPAESRAVTLEELREHPGLTPEKFAAYFSGFKFEFRAYLRPAKEFLESESGDCDDYSILADKILSEKGYHTHLVAVRMQGVGVHVVCYVEELHGYLDYNFRKGKKAWVEADWKLDALADSVIQSFLAASWSSVSEFTFDQARNSKVLVRTLKREDLVP